MTTEVAYARIPSDLKSDVEAHAERYGLSQTAAIVALLEQGLHASTLERRVRRLEDELAHARSDAQGALASLSALEEREETLRLTYDGLVLRLERPVATCPHCAVDVRGYDLLAAHTGEVVQELIQCVAGFEIIQQSLDRYPGADEHRGST